MPQLQGAAGEFRFTLEITRAETGKKETVEMIGYLEPGDDEAATSKEKNNVTDTQHNGA